MDKITILTPAYQAEKYIERYINIVLNFDYKNIELIIINDGSTDKTDEIIQENKQRIKEANIEFKYVKLEENKGQANAIDIGLKLVTGKYLSWQDVDDIYLPNCLSKCLKIMKENPEYKIIFSNSLKIQEKENNDFEKEKNIIDYSNKKYIILGNLPSKPFIHKNLFKDYILRKNVIWGPMRFVDTEALFNTIKDKSIYINKRGQNAQLILPMVYKYKWFYIDEILSYYVVYQNSHSHKNTHYSLRFDFEKLMIETIKRIEMPILQKIGYILLTKIKFLKDDLQEYEPFRLSLNIKRKTFNLSIFKKNILSFSISKKTK